MTLFGDASSRLRSYSNNDALLPVRRKVGKITCKEPHVYVGDYLVLPCVVRLKSAGRHHLLFGMDAK